MEPKKKKAWLITWEGDEWDKNKRCKIAAVLPPQFGDNGLRPILQSLFNAIYNFTLDEKVDAGISGFSKHLFFTPYRDLNQNYLYGFTPHEYLSARKVKDLWWETNKNNQFECTLHWTELSKYVHKQMSEFQVHTENPLDRLTEVSGEIERHYTYSTR